MAQRSKIEWTDATWNPIRGCSRVSEGCRNCYAERIAARFSGHGEPYQGLALMKNGKPHWTGQVRLIEETLTLPLRWKKPRRVFVNSMSDLFHEALGRKEICRILEIMRRSTRHVFQVLTKRPARMREILEHISAFSGTPPAHIWWGVSVENQQTADKRIPLLLQTPAAVRWVSYEPALGPVDFNRINYRLQLRTSLKSFLEFEGKSEEEAAKEAEANTTGGEEPLLDVLRGHYFDGWDSGTDGKKLDWVVAGGESGSGARPAHPDWFRSVRDQCQAAGVPFFFKQWGEWEPSLNFPEQFKNARPTTPCMMLAADGHTGHSQAEMQGHPRFGLVVRTGKKAAGRLLDGREFNEYPER